jgi:predicted RNase H-like HicB family nuclease
MAPTLSSSAGRVSFAPVCPPPPRLLGPCYAHGVKLIVVLQRDETGVIVAECPAIPGCVSQGKTEDEALANVREAIVACLDVRAEQGLPLTVRTVEVEVAVA